MVLQSALIMCYNVGGSIVHTASKIPEDANDDYLACVHCLTGLMTSATIACVQRRRMSSRALPAQHHHKSSLACPKSIDTHFCLSAAESRSGKSHIGERTMVGLGSRCHV
jgi:hypothetical protein